MENVLHLCGDIKAAPTISHESHGIVFYTFPLSVERLSGAWDTLNVIAPEAMCRRCAEGARMRLFGQVRSYNNHGAEGSRLQISAWAKSLEESADACDNRVLLHGVLCKPPVYRCTPYGREITDIMLRVERGMPPELLNTARRPRFDYIPCVTWGSVARMCAALEPYTPVTFEGRLQSRAYMKTIGTETQTRTAYEVSVAQCTLL